MLQLLNTIKTYQGKVRNLYVMPNNKIVLEASNRISAFDCILPKPIPYKGQVLNQLAAFMLHETATICPNWLQKSIEPNIGVGIACEALKVEVVVRGYLSGHAWRQYKQGITTICGVTLPNGLIENQKLPMPIITPTTKASEGHDADITEQEILQQNLVSAHHWEKVKKYALNLFEFGSKYALSKGLILVDTKYEFGLYNNEVVLMDEIHTPDSSRYFYADDYSKKMAENKKPNQLSKEFVREWLIANNFMGKDGETMPEMTEDFVIEISEKYIHLYETITGKKFVKQPINEADQIEAIHNYLNNAN